jgi:hypothetical protein
VASPKNLTQTAVQASPTTLTKWEHFEIFRDYVKREDELINQRLTWNLAIQGFLFATYGFSLQKLAEVQSKALIEKGAEFAKQVATHSDVIHLKSLVALMPWVGALMAFVVWLAILAARLAIAQLNKNWNDAKGIHTGTQPDLPDLLGGGVAFANSLGFWAPLAIPLIFVVGWAWIGSVLAH